MSNSNFKLSTDVLTYVLRDQSSPQTLLGTFSIPVITGVKLGSLTTNGLVKTTGSNGTLSVDTNDYLTVSTAASTYQTIGSYLTTETDPLSIHLNQTSPQTFTAGTVSGSGILKVTSGTLGLDTNSYLTSVTAHSLLSTTHGDSLADTVVKGDVMIGNDTPKWSRLPGNTTTTKKYLQSVGAGGVAGTPVFEQIDYADLSGTPSGLTGYLKIDQSNGPVTGDISISKTAPEFRLTDELTNYSRIYRTSSSNELNLKNKLRMTSGQNAIAFNGSSSFMTFASPSISTAMSISMWFKKTTTTGVKYLACVDGLTLAYGSSTQIQIYPDSGGSPQSNITVSAMGSGWHHIIWTQNGTTGIIYLDGVKYTTGATSSIVLYSSLNGIGNYPHGNPTFWKIFDGSIDEVGIWSRALSDSEALVLWNSGNGVVGNVLNAPYTTSFKCGWHFNEGTGNTAADFSGNNKTATGTGTPTWSTGVVTFPTDVIETNIITHTEVANTGEFGILTIGDPVNSPRLVLDSSSTRFNIGGVEKGQITSSAFTYSQPNQITGSSDAVQLKVTPYSSQVTNDVFQIMGVDTTTVRFSTDIKGYVKIINSTGVNNVWIAGGTSGVPASLTGNYNTVIGDNAGKAATSGQYNIALGWSAMSNGTFGSYNIAIGTETLKLNNNNSNIGIGMWAGRDATGSAYNMFLGISSGMGAGSKVENTIVGYYAANGLTTGGSNVILGHKAGYNQTTNSNLLIIDNQNRTSAALELTNSMVYGVFNSVPASQTIAFNVGQLSVTAGTAQSTISRGLVINTSLTSGATGAFNVKGSSDQSLIITDAVNDRVGIGMTPLNKLDVYGVLGVNNAIGQSNFAKGLIVNSSLGTGATDAFNAKGSGDQSLIITDTANDRVGIGVAAPTVKLDVGGNTKITGSLTVVGNMILTGQTLADPSVGTAQMLPITINGLTYYIQLYR